MSDNEEPKLKQLNKPRHSTHRVYDPKGLARTLKANTGAKTGLYAVSSSIREGGRIETRAKFGEANTLTTGKGCSGGMKSTNDVVTDKVRRLTPIECERLQGFPDNWTKGVSDTQRYRCMGNAVTVPVIEYIASKLVL